MTPRCSGYIIIAVLLFAASHIKAQQWFTPDVAREVGREPCDNCKLGGGDEKPVKVGPSQITAVTMFVFDTIATYAQGRVVDLGTGKPIKGALIQTSYTCWKGCNVKVAATNEAGFFCLGWVGCHGVKDARSNRPLLVRVAGYQTISTEVIEFGGGAYLHIELAALPKQR